MVVFPSVGVALVDVSLLAVVAVGVIVAVIAVLAAVAFIVVLVFVLRLANAFRYTAKKL